MAKLELFDGVCFNYVGIDKNKEWDNDFGASLDTQGLLNWNRDTIVLANFDGDTSGSNFSGSFEGLDHFDIYKQITGETVLHKVYTTSSADETIIEDFVIDGSSEYTYFVYPVCLTDEEKGLYTVSYPLSAGIKNDSNGYVNIIGLTYTDGVYRVNENEVWRFDLNLENTGTTLTIDKTFSDTQHRFPKMTGGNRKYNKASVKGLIGKCSCDGSYVDTNTLISEWETFAASNCLKLFKDKRGRLMLVDIDSSSIEYMDCYPYPAAVSFSVTEIEDLNNVEIDGRAIPYNTATEILLADMAAYLLQDKEKVNLTVSR